MSPNPHVYEVRPRKDHHGVNLFPMRCHSGRLRHGELDSVESAIKYAKFYNRSHDAVIRVYNEAGNVIDTYEHAAEFKQC